eukprot:4888413-Heterocapsa_arctica.AAC.1
MNSPAGKERGGGKATPGAEVGGENWMEGRTASCARALYLLYHGGVWVGPGELGDRAKGGWK